MDKAARQETGTKIGQGVGRCSETFNHFLLLEILKISYDLKNSSGVLKCKCRNSKGRTVPQNAGKQALRVQTVLHSLYCSLQPRGYTEKCRFFGFCQAGYQTDTRGDGSIAGQKMNKIGKNRCK